ncbi:MAG: hypothetical protein RBS80_02370 [Thermoguttaceae bacterium]|jgi:hypothetical protein|nr:hypothetical protein [Thermoguttaceae bacterium]
MLMQATIVDLRYRMNDVLKALDRNEDVEILCRGKKRGVLKAHPQPTQQAVADHPFFGMRYAEESVDAEMDALRGGRYRDI